MKWKFEIENDSLSQPREITHYSGKDFKMTWSREDERKYDFKQEIGEIILLHDDFKYYYDLERSNTRCDLQTLNIYLICGNYPELKYTGTFSMSAGKWDLDKCTVKFKIKTLDPYTCIEETTEDVNVLKSGLTPQVANFGFEYGYDSFDCVWPGECGFSIDDKGLYQIKLENSIGFHWGFLWHYIISDCSYNPGPEWEIVSPCSGGLIKYRKPIDKQYSPEIDEEKTIKDIAYFDNKFDFVLNFQPKTSLDNGIKLIDVLQHLLNKVCDGYIIVSDFFQWNPENISEINYLTLEINKYANLILFQKSDVKRPDTLNNATKAEINFKKLFDDILKIFNCGYKITGNTFRIEHIAWFESDLGLNLVQIDTKNQFLRGTRKYSYESNKLPKYEKFSFMESGYTDFIGKDIVYDSNCVNNDKENEFKNEVENITTDVFYCLENSDSDSDNVSDAGFVLIACDNNNNIIWEPGILSSDNVPNNVLSWAHLHRDLWQHGRVLKTGVMNGVETEFKSVVPTIKQDKFGCVINCSHINDFNPLDKVKSALGWGYVQSAELTLSQCKISFELLLEEIQQGKETLIFGDFDSDFSEEFD